MEKIYRIILLFVSIVLTGCAKDDQYAGNLNDTFIATFENQQTKTYVDGDVKQYWTNGDAISLFSSATNRQYVFKGATGSTTACFEEVGTSQDNSPAFTENYAVYPYSGEHFFTDDKRLVITLPNSQNYAEESFGEGTNTMVAVTSDADDKRLYFKQVCGFIRLKLYGDATISSIVLLSNGNERIAGQAVVTATNTTDPSLQFSQISSWDYITLDCGKEGVALGSTEQTATSFWFVVPPVTFDEGFTVIITTSEGAVISKSTDKEYVVVRNQLKTMTTFDLSQIQAHSEIWYTSADGNIVTPVTTDGIGEGFVSNVYSNGKGVIRFKGLVESLPEGMFKGCKTLKSVSLPEDVTSIGASAFQNCSALETIAMQEGITSIGKMAFWGCSSLESIDMPSGITSIEFATFFNCSALNSITIPGNVSSINGNAFSGCDKLVDVYCLPQVPFVLAYNAFETGVAGRKFHVYAASLPEYQKASVWKDFASEIIGDLDAEQ